MSYSAALQIDRNTCKATPVGTILVVSIVFHLLLIIGIPLALKLVWKQKKFERPKTFQLVTPIKPVHSKRVPVREAPKQRIPQRETKPEPRQVPTQKETLSKNANPQPKKEAAKPVEENLDELASLLDELPVPAQVSAVGDFKYHWYLNSVQQKLERNWNPPTENREVKVVVSFTIHHDGTISEPVIGRSSGNSTIDNLAVRAVKLSAPFGKLPPGFAGDRLELNCTLIPTRK